MLKNLALMLFLLVTVACGPVDKLQAEHSAALRKHTYISDIDQYGIQNKWVASLKGDCEDYALVMKNKLGGKLLYVRTTGGVAHIVLDVDGRIVDNMSARVYSRSEMKHKYVYTVKENEIERWLAKARDHDKEIRKNLLANGVFGSEH